MPKIYWNPTENLRKTEDGSTATIDDAFSDKKLASGKYFAAANGNVATNLNTDSEVNIAAANNVITPKPQNAFIQPVAQDQSTPPQPAGVEGSPDFGGPIKPAGNQIAPVAPLLRDFTGDMPIIDQELAQTNLQKQQIRSMTGPQGLTTSQQQILKRIPESQAQQFKRMEFARAYPDWARSKGNSARSLSEYDESFRQSFKNYMGVSPELDTQIRQTWEKYMPRTVKAEWEDLQSRRSESRALNQANEQIAAQYGDQALPDPDTPGVKIMPKVAQYIDGKLTIGDNPAYQARKQELAQERTLTGQENRQKAGIDAKIAEADKRIAASIERAKQRDLFALKRDEINYDRDLAKMAKQFENTLEGKKQFIEYKKKNAEEVIKRYPNLQLHIDESGEIQDDQGNFLSQLVRAAAAKSENPAPTPTQSATPPTPAAKEYASVDEYKASGMADQNPVIGGKQYRLIRVEKDGKRYAKLEAVK